MINEEAWHLQKHGNTNILVDEDTMFVMQNMVCEFGFEATSDTILTCKLTSTIEDEDERNIEWNTKYEYAKGVNKAAFNFFDKSKVEELADAMKQTTISENTDSDSDATGPKT